VNENVLAGMKLYQTTAMSGAAKPTTRNSTTGSAVFSPAVNPAPKYCLSRPSR